MREKDSYNTSAFVGLLFKDRYKKFRFTKYALEYDYS
jgi:hypothetical protein